MGYDCKKKITGGYVTTLGGRYERLKEVADRGIYGYSMLGDGYYHALKNWFSERFGWQVEKDWVIVTPGVVFALAAAVRAYTKEGDSVMIQRPVYHPFTNVVKEN